MKALFEDINYLDKRLVDEFGLSEDLMMEHAANSLNRCIRKKIKKNQKIQIICGPGNNGADGLACARMLFKDYKVSIFLPLGAKSNMCKLQFSRAKKLNIKIDEKIKNASCHVDCLFGSGLDRELSEDILNLIDKVNLKKSFKLACDIPTGVMKNGSVSKNAFKANKTISMGALKIGLFNDEAKDFIGHVSVCDLGVSSKIYESKSQNFLLQKKDLSLPKRKKQNVHKGSFGHFVVVSGEKRGASLLSAKAGFVLGAGLVSMLGAKKLPNYLMKANKMPQNTTSMALGMGLGKIKDFHINLLTKTNTPCVLDADILHFEDLKTILQTKQNIVLTPHLKEFAIMLKNLNFGTFSTHDIAKNRFDLARKFSLKFPQILVLKGANTIIAQNGKLFINSFGTSALAKGGSGDVLSGFIGSLLAQNYSLLNSAVNGVLAHSLAIKKYKYNDFSLKPNDIIKGVRKL